MVMWGVGVCVCVCVCVGGGYNNAHGKNKLFHHHLNKISLGFLVTITVDNKSLWGLRCRLQLMVLISKTNKLIQVAVKVWV